MSDWRSFLSTGNDYFNNASFSTAQTMYEHAIKAIEQQWQGELNNQELLFGWIAGMHNLAELYGKQLQNDIAFMFLRHTHEQVSELINHPELTPMMQMLALRASNMTLSKLMLFAKQHNICADVIKSPEKKQHDSAIQAQPVYH